MKKLIQRTRFLHATEKSFKGFPVVAILGPRQSGKTTLARTLTFDHYFDLENPKDLAALDQAQLALEDLSGLVVIDEIQRKPELFPLLRHLVDRKGSKARFLILGSASIELLKQSSESLAGRINYIHMSGFLMEEIQQKDFKNLWLRGGLPKSFLAKSDSESSAWREQYIRTFLERDIPQLGLALPATTMRRLWTMLAHLHGQVLNYSELSRSFGVSDNTVRRYVEVLEHTFMIRSLLPWHDNAGKRLVKRPKIYIQDSGILHSLLTIETRKSLLSHPKLGASWEGFIIDQIIRGSNLPDSRFHFWATHAGAELDLFWQKNGKNYGAEVKFADAPKLTPSMTNAIKDLKLSHLWVVYPGDKEYKLSPKITVLPYTKIGIIS